MPEEDTAALRSAIGMTRAGWVLSGSGRLATIVTTIKFAVVGLLMMPVVVFSQDIPDALLKIRDNIAQQALFEVTVTGTMQFGKQQTIQGKAFAVNEHLLVASKLLVRNDADWDNGPSPANEPEKSKMQLLEKLGVKALNRAISIKNATGPVTKSAFIVEPDGSSPGVVGIVAPNTSFKSLFSLSLCGIEREKIYYIFLDRDPNAPADDEQDHLQIMPIKATGYDPLKFGPLYTFSIEENPGDITFATQHGTPILDENGNVVAVLSGTLRVDGKMTVVAAPVQAFFPGASALWANSVKGSGSNTDKCVISDTVKEIKDDVGSQLSWRLETESTSDSQVLYLVFDRTNKSSKLKNVKIRAGFRGKRKAEDVSEEIFHYKDFKFELTDEQISKRRFSAQKIIEYTNSNLIEGQGEDGIQYQKSQTTMGYLTVLEIAMESAELEGGGKLNNLGKIKLVACKQKFGQPLEWYTEENRCKTYE
jgi:hypothetical protein